MAVYSIYIFLRYHSYQSIVLDLLCSKITLVLAGLALNARVRAGSISCLLQPATCSMNIINSNKRHIKLQCSINNKYFRDLNIDCVCVSVCICVVCIGCGWNMCINVYMYMYICVRNPELIISTQM